MTKRVRHYLTDVLKCSDDQRLAGLAFSRRQRSFGIYPSLANLHYAPSRPKLRVQKTPNFVSRRKEEFQATVRSATSTLPFVSGLNSQRQQKAQNREVRAPLFSIFKPEMLANTLTTCLMMASAFVIYYANYALFATHLQLDLHLSPALVALPIALANTCFFLSSLFWGWLAERIGRRWAIIIPAALGVPTAFLYLLTQDYTLIVIGFALQGMFACGGMHVQYPAYLSERFPTEVRATAVAFCFHQGAIWGGLISPLLILYATTHQIGLSGPILVTTVVGLGIFLVAVLLSPETKGKVLVADLTVA